MAFPKVLSSFRRVRMVVIKGYFFVGEVGDVIYCKKKFSRQWEAIFDQYGVLYNLFNRKSVSIDPCVEPATFVLKDLLACLLAWPARLCDLINKL